MSASELWKLREWLTVHEAAQYLSSAVGYKMGDADILRLALDGHLALSVNVPAGARAIFRKENATTGAGWPERIDGLWDLPMFGAGRLEVESWYNRLCNLPYLHVDGSVGAFVEREGIRCQLPPERGRTGMSPKASSALADGAVIVVRVALLDAVVAHLPRCMRPSAGH